MKIDKYKKLKNGKYELLLENGEKLELYENTILKFDLLIKKNINSDIRAILDFDKDEEVYYKGLKYLKVKPRSKKEIFDYLLGLDYQSEHIEKALNKLESQGYINDLFYAKSFLHNKLITTSSGPLKIKKELQKKGITLDITDQILEEYDQNIQLEKIRKIIAKMIKSNRNKSNQVLKRKIISDLTMQGFSIKDVEKVIQESTFLEDKDIEKKEYEKLYKKLSRKYEGSELEFQIRKRMYQKGFSV